jgi:signal peptidase II
MKQQVLKYTFFLLIVFTGCATDQWSKKWAAGNLKNQSVKILIPNAIDLSYTENRGMVFGINNRSGNNASKNLLLIVRILLSIGLIVYISIARSRPLLFHVPLLLILSGALGNIIDSIRFGHVIDFIHMHLGKVLDWPFLFNLADAYVCVGMGIILLQSFLSGKKNKAAQSPKTS